MARKDFDDPDAYRGGALGTTTAPKRLRYPCFADGCTMPGTIFMAGTDKAGVCAWHYGVQAPDIPRVTRALKDWGCVAYEVEAARRTLTDPDIAAKPGLIAERLETAWARLMPQLHEHQAELNPGRDNYGRWAQRLEAFLGARVVETLGVRQRRAA